MDQHVESLKNYIVQQMHAGQTPDEIAGQLTNAGWTQEYVRQAFHAVQTSLLPTSMQHVAAADATPQPSAFGQRRGRIRTGWLLLKQSAKILNGNRYLFRFLLMSWLTILLVEAMLCVIVFFFWRMFTGSDGNDNAWWYLFSFVSYIIIYFVINYYTAALTANILDIFNGKRVSYHEYISAARAKAWPIFVYSVFDAIVGMILRYIIERIRFVGWILSWLLGTAWSLGTTFVLPILMNSERPKTIPAIKQSISFFKQTWGENVVAKATVNTPLALINIVIQLVAWPLLIVAILNAGIGGFLLVFIPWAFLTISLAMLGSFANNTVNVALYYYAVNRQVPPGFSSDMLNNVFRERKHFRKGAKSQTAS